ncbi:MAG: CoxG family protein [Halolamina sp.]
MNSHDEHAVAVTVERTVDADPVAVWRAASDPQLTQECLPGCESVRSAEQPRPAVSDPLAAVLDRPAEQAFDSGERFEAELGIGAAGVTLPFDAEVRIEEREYPRMRIAADADGEGGRFETRASLSLARTDDGATEVTWQAEADVAGRAATLGVETLEPVVRRVANGYFDDLAHRIENRSPDSSGAASSPS